MLCHSHKLLYLRLLKKLSTILFALLICSVGEAQYLWDFGASIGGTNYLGDIGGKELPRRDFVYDMELKETNIAFGAHIRRKLSRSLSAKAALFYGRISGDDVNTEYGPRQARNLHFRNDVKEISIQFEYTLYSDNDFGGRGLYNPNFRVYAFGGIGAIHHNPQAEFEGTWMDLRPLRLEGQSEEYNEIELSNPVGFGFYFTYNRRYRFGWELGYRFTSTDYLDDVSGFYAYDSELGDDPIRIAMANRTTPEIIEQVWPGQPGQIFNYEYNSEAEALGQRNRRGIGDNNDGFLYMNLSAGMVIVKPSKSFKMKRRHSWLKGKVKKSRKSRAKF